MMIDVIASSGEAIRADRLSLISLEIVLRPMMSKISLHLL